MSKGYAWLRSAFLCFRCFPFELRIFDPFKNSIKSDAPVEDLSHHKKRDKLLFYLKNQPVKTYSRIYEQDNDA